jgi:hypothetical protein
MRIRVAVPEDYVEPSVINAALEAVTRIDQAMLANGDAPVFNPENPGVKWRPEPPGDEHFDNVQTVIQRGWGDCDDLAPWRAASLRATGEDPHAVAIVVPSGPSMFHAIVRRGDGSNDDPSVAAGMRAKSVVGDGENLISVWACDPHDGRIYQGSLAPTVAPLEAHCGPTWAVRPITEIIGRRITVVGYEGRVDCPVIGSRMGRVHRHHHRRRHHHRHPHHTHHVHQHLHVGFAPYALSCTAGGRDIDQSEALAVACAGAIHAGMCAGTASREDHYKLFAMHHLLAGHHPSQTVIELAKLMAADHAEDTAASYAVHGYHGRIVVGSFGDFLKSALSVVTAVAPALSAIPGVGPVLSQALPMVNMIAQPLLGHPGAPQPGLSPQPQALAAARPVAPSARPAPPVIRAQPYNPNAPPPAWAASIPRPAPPPPRPAPPPPPGGGYAPAPPQQAAPAAPAPAAPSPSAFQQAASLFSQAEQAFNAAVQGDAFTSQASDPGWGLQPGYGAPTGSWASDYWNAMMRDEGPGSGPGAATATQLVGEEVEDVPEQSFEEASAAFDEASRAYETLAHDDVEDVPEQSFEEASSAFEAASAAFDALSVPLEHDEVVDVPEHEPSFEEASSAFDEASRAYEAQAHYDAQPATRLSWDALQALHEGNFHGGLGPLFIDF